MTYCVGMKMNRGLVFMSDTRTNAGIDNVSTFRKMFTWEKPGERVIMLLSAGNLSISQSVREILQAERVDRGVHEEPLTIWNAASMFDAARVLGEASAAAALRQHFSAEGDKKTADEHGMHSPGTDAKPPTLRMHEKH